MASVASVASMTSMASVVSIASTDSSMARSLPNIALSKLVCSLRMEILFQGCSGEFLILRQNLADIF